MLAVLGKLGWFFRLEWKRYFIGIALLILAGMIEIMPPRMIGNSIDALHMGTMTADTLVRTIVAYCGLMVIIYAVTFIWMYNIFGGAFIVERMLRSSFMRHLLKMTPTFYERNRTGDLMARATNDLKSVATTAGFGILTLVDSSVWMVTLLITMSVMISWKLTLMAMLPLPIIALAMRIYGRTIHERFKAAQDAFGEMNDSVLETVSGVRVVRAYVQEEAEIARFRATTEDVYHKNAAVAKVDALFEPTIKITIGASYLLGLGYGAYLVFNNAITLGELISFNVYLGMLIWPMFAIGELINVMQRGNASLDRVNETLHYNPDVENHKELITGVMPESIEFDRVTFRYPTGAADSLREVSLTLKRGQTLGIVGRTGGGKTTLLKQLLREYPAPAGGSIRIGGVPLERIPLDELHAWVGYVPQEQILFSKTVRENILFGDANASEADVLQALELASFKKDLNLLSHGVETLVGEKGVALSGGQKQRISIARALLREPEILILDDAMSAVDAKTEAAIIDHVREDRSGKTTLIAAHRLSAVQHADLIIVLDDGRIVEEGTHEQLLALGGWYKEQYDRQQAEESLSA